MDSEVIDYKINEIHRNALDQLKLVQFEYYWTLSNFSNGMIAGIVAACLAIGIPQEIINERIAANKNEFDGDL